VLADRLGIRIDPNAKVRSLSVANQQLLSIMRALEAEHGIIIMDEPTASLGPREREKLYEIVRGLRESGVTIIYVSHDLDEVLMLCDAVTVLRDGRVSATRTADCWTKEDLVAAMLGRLAEEEPLVKAMLGHTVDVSEVAEKPAGREVLRVENMMLPGLLEGVSFTLHEGEILGIAGLVGVGRTELLRALAGAEPVGQGQLFIDGKEERWPKNVRAALRLGVALCPEERKTQGLVLSLTAAANVALSNMSAVSVGPFVSKKRRSRAAQGLTDRLSFDARRLGDQARVLSGGNQQKLVIAKSLHRRPRVLLLDEPTRGVDVGARNLMFALIRRLSVEGLALVVVSSELEEVVDLADRVMVLASGRNVCTF
jgi:ABC-type sugar transport system ATPase subunit